MAQLQNMSYRSCKYGAKLRRHSVTCSWCMRKIFNPPGQFTESGALEVFKFFGDFLEKKEES